MTQITQIISRLESIDGIGGIQRAVELSLASAFRALFLVSQFFIDGGALLGVKQ